jgi:chloramphenicol-sensitive protein RarD
LSGSTPGPDEDTTRAGLLYGAAAYLLWGLFPLFWPLLEPAGTLEILAHRMVWSLVVVVIVLRLTGGFAGLRAVLRDRYQRSYLALAAVVITVNWGTYIWGVNSGHVVETSLGYFINPLFTIVLGVAVLGERLRRAQWVAVAIGAAAVVVITVDYGRLPWIALTLATSFGLYGYFKKRAAVGAVDSLAVETGVLFLPALATLVVIGARGELAFGHHGAANTLLLASTGVVTAVPLLLFAASTRRLPLSVLGLLQYLAPVLQFSVGVGVRHEPLPTAELIGFALVWLALLVLTVDGVRAPRRGRARLAQAPPVATESGG